MAASVQLEDQPVELGADPHEDPTEDLDGLFMLRIDGAIAAGTGREE